MTCFYRLDDWIRYVNHELSEQEMSHFEQHLAICSSCLVLYERAIVNHIETFECRHGPIPDVTDSVMANIKRPHIEVESANDTVAILDTDVRAGQQIQIQKRTTLFHYAVAASIAFILSSVGVFDEFVYAMEQTEAVTSQTKSWVDLIISSPQQWWADLIKDFKSGE